MAIIKVRDNAKHDDFSVGDVNDKNLIINGAMNVWQRGTTASITSSTPTGLYTVDRWMISPSNIGNWTQSQSTDVPDGQGFGLSLKMDCTTAKSSLDSTSRLYLEQRLEGLNLQNFRKGNANAKDMALSFWVKSGKTGTHIIELFDYSNYRHISKSYTISSADTWQKVEITFPGDITGEFDNDNQLALIVRFWMAAGTFWSSGTLNTSWNDFTSPTSYEVSASGQVNLADSTSNEFYITGVQLEAGTTATEFEHEFYGDTIIKCQRYFFAYGNYGTGSTNNNRRYSSRYGGSASFVHIHYPEKMRAMPTLNYSISGGAISTDYSTRTGAQLYDSDDTGFYVYDFTANGEL
jgi:hypothetical protein